MPTTDGAASMTDPTRMMKRLAWHGLEVLPTVVFLWIGWTLLRHGLYASGASRAMVMMMGVSSVASVLFAVGCIQDYLAERRAARARRRTAADLVASAGICYVRQEPTTQERETPMNVDKPCAFASSLMSDEQIAEVIRRQTVKILVEGRLELIRVESLADPDQVSDVYATVHGHRGDHLVQFGRSAGWSCDCPDAAAVSVCAHVAAAEMVTHAVAPAGTDAHPKGQRA